MQIHFVVWVYQLTDDFSYRKQISKLWFNHNTNSMIILIR